MSGVRCGTRVAMLVVIAFGAQRCVVEPCRSPVPCAVGASGPVATWHFEGGDTPGASFAGAGVSIVDTWNPGEHALQVTAGSSANAVIGAALPGAAAVSVTMVVRCDPGASMVVGTNGAFRPANANADGTWSAQVQSIFLSGATPFCIAETQPFTLSSMTLIASGAGACQIDDINVSSAAFNCSGAVAPCGDPCHDAGPPNPFTIDATAADIRIEPRPATAFTPCGSDEECQTSGHGSSCRTEYPGGLCAFDCSSRGFCGPREVCVQDHCLPACLGSGDTLCDQWSSLCTPTDAAAVAYACTPSCWLSSEPPEIAQSAAACGGGTMCDLWSGRCQLAPSSGRDDGAPCFGNSNCRSGRCQLELDPRMRTPTGFLGGYCMGRARYPGAGAYAGTTLPTANCAPGTVVLPADGSRANGGGSGDCFSTCIIDTDCRGGYRCDHDPRATGANYTNGACVPLNCNVIGQSCPSGYHCPTTPGDPTIPFAVCVAGSSDAGTPADGAGSMDGSPPMDAAASPDATAMMDGSGGG